MSCLGSNLVIRVARCSAHQLLRDKNLASVTVGHRKFFTKMPKARLEAPSTSPSVFDPNGLSPESSRSFLEKKMTQALGNELAKQVPTYKTLKDFSLILKLYPLGSFTPEFMHVFEEYLLNFLEKSENDISTEDLTYLLNLLSSTKKRPIKILKTISTHLSNRFERCKLIDTLEAEHLAGTLFALNKLSYNDIELLTKLCDVLSNMDPSFVPNIKRNTFVSLLTSLGQLRFLHEPLLNQVMKSLPHIMTSRRAFGSPELACIFITLSKLGYKPKNLNDICQEYILPNVKQNKIRHESVWIDFLWSLAYFDQVDRSHPLMKEVLDPRSPFVKSIEDRVNDGDVSCRTDLSKILNIQALLLGSPSSQEKLVFGQEERVDQLFEPPPRSQDCLAFSRNVTDTLNFFVPRGSHMELGVRTKLGFTIDARFVVSSDLKTLALDKFTSSPVIPEGFHRVNILTASFRQSLLNDPTQASGQIKMAERIIKDVLRETTVVVTPSPFFSKNDTVQKVSFLQKLIREAIYRV